MEPFRQAQPIHLTGAPFERGRQQAELFPELIDTVRQAVLGRLEGVREDLEQPAIRQFLRQQWTFSELRAKECLEEMRGIASGFSLSPEDLLAYLHLGVVTDVAQSAPHEDGCSAWAVSTPSGGVLGKNRDFRSEHTALQRVFLHSDPAWNGRDILTVGSLGSPGAYSSGINSDGLAVADTQIGTRDHGVGMLRYFLMSVLLVSCTTVEEALQLIVQTVHVGGGSLVIADAAGGVASVELGHSGVSSRKAGKGWLGCTNHFVSAQLAGTQQGLPGAAMDRSSHSRLKFLATTLPGLSEDFRLARAMTMMASHENLDSDGLCRHGEDGDAFTISASLYRCQPPSLDFCAGTPCSGGWLRYVV